MELLITTDNEVAPSHVLARALWEKINEFEEGLEEYEIDSSAVFLIEHDALAQQCLSLFQNCRLKVWDEFAVEIRKQVVADFGGEDVCDDD